MINRCLKKCPHGKNKSCGQFGFTLVELLFVCFILGIIAAVAVPNFSVIASGGQIGIASREIMAAGRYARTMALLYQTPVELVLRPVISNDGEEQRHTLELSIEARERTEGNVMGIHGLDSVTNGVSSVEEDTVGSVGSLDGFSRGSRYSSGTQSFGMAVSRADRDEQTSFRDDDDDIGGLTGVQIEMLDASGAPMQDSATSIKTAIDTKRTMNGVKIRFEGYSDVARSNSAFSRFSKSDTTVVDSGEIRIRYRANGTVRPYKLFITDEEGNEQIVEVNSVGTGKSYKED